MAEALFFVFFSEDSAIIEALLRTFLPSPGFPKVDGCGNNYKCCVRERVGCIVEMTGSDFRGRMAAHETRWAKHLRERGFNLP